MNRTLIRNLAVTLLWAVFFLPAFHPLASFGATIYVPADHTTIQDAVNSAFTDDTVLVSDGIYAENIIIDKPLTLRSLNGYTSTTIEAPAGADGIKIISDNVTVEGFTVVGPDEQAPYSNFTGGIHIEDGGGNIIKNNRFTEHWSGIVLLVPGRAGYVSNNLIIGNVSEDNGFGIYLNSTGNSVIGNTVSENGYGIYVLSSSNTINGNTAYKNIQDGLRFAPGTIGNVVIGNTLTNNSGRGISNGGEQDTFHANFSMWNDGDPNPETYQWVTVGGGAWGADLVSDGQTLYRVGGDFQCHSIYRYDSPSQNSWSLVTDENPQCYSHRSPGEGNRSWYYDGKIVVAGHSHPLHPGGNNVTIYDLASGEWTVHELPVFDHFSWGQAGALNSFSGKVYILWTEEGTSHTFATAVLDISTGTWSSYDRTSRIGQGPVALEDTSGQFVFDLVRGDRYVKLNMYDLQSQDADFSGTWSTSSTLDLGPGDFFMNLDRNYGSYTMAWDSVEEKLYLVATERGTTLSYDPSQDSWHRIDSRPEKPAYRDGHAAIAHGRLYSQTGDQLWYMPLR